MLQAGGVVLLTQLSAGTSAICKRDACLGRQPYVMMSNNSIPLVYASLQAARAIGNNRQAGRDALSSVQWK